MKIHTFSQIGQFHTNHNEDHLITTSKNQRLNFSQIEDLSIATDGIFSFQPFDVGEYETARMEDIIDWLLKDRTFKGHEVMLKKKVLFIEKTWGLKPSDDLSLVRILF